MAPKNNKKSTQPSSGKSDKPKSNREKMAQRRSEAQVFRNLDKTDYNTVRFWAKPPYKNAPDLKNENLSPREYRERRRKAQRATEYLEKKYPTFTKKVKEGKITNQALVDATIDKDMNRASHYPTKLGSSKAKKQAATKGLKNVKLTATPTPKGLQPKTIKKQEKAKKALEKAYRERNKYGK